MPKGRAFLRPGGTDASTTAIDDDTVEVLDSNWNTVAVFRRCTWTLAGMNGERVGIAGQEIRSVCSLARIPRAEWPGILDGIVLVMVPTFLEAKKQPNG